MQLNTQKKFSSNKKLPHKILIQNSTCLPCASRNSNAPMYNILTIMLIKIVFLIKYFRK